MDPVERLASDLQALKNRFDEMSLRFAVGEEREKRVDDKIDNMVSALRSEMGGLRKSVDGWNTTGRWVLTVIGAVIIVAVVKWMLTGNLAGVL